MRRPSWKKEQTGPSATGEEQAATIRAEGEVEAKRIRTQAETDKLRLEGQARAESTRILNEAHKEAPEFYRTVKLLEAYKEMFGDDKTQLILSLDHPLLSLFKDVPKNNGSAGKANKPTPATPSLGPPTAEKRE